MSSDVLDLSTMRPDAKAEPLHLLRQYTGWRGVKEYSTKEAIRHIHCPPDPFFVFGTHTSRYPVRAEDMAGGSVYWCKRGVTMFRMPLHGIEASSYGWWILMEPVAIPVEPKTVGQVRGWRYLDDSRRPSDNPGLKEQLLAEIQLEDQLGPGAFVGIDLARGESMNG